MKIHLGCGKRDWPGWLNVDGGDFPHVIHRDVTLQHFLPEQADLIYASHLFEYFDREEGLEILKNWYKVLKPAGILRIAVPDFHKLAEAYLQHGFELKDILGPLFGKMQMGDKTIYHKTTYDFTSLCGILEAVGFKNVNGLDWRDNEYDDHSRAHLPHDPAAIASGDFKCHHIPISLNVEAEK